MTSLAVDPAADTDEGGVRGWALRVLDRIGHVWFENPMTLVAFIGRLFAAAPLGLAALGSSRAGSVATRLGQQFFRTLIRGVVLVAALGIAGGLVIGTLSRIGGSFLQPLIEEGVLKVVVRDLAPLGLAVALAGRMGVSITAKLAVLPARLKRETLVFGRREINEFVVPQLVAGLTTAPLLFFLLAWFLLAGYESSGRLMELLYASPGRFFVPELWPPLAAGAWRSAGFGWVVAFVASALGVRAAERFASSGGEEIELTNAVWESSVTAILICTAFTIIFLTRAGNG
jgi:ABC-type transporter Mla maintaining outer membrane lipid asymmetry permease subunit MlaE